MRYCRHLPIILPSEILTELRQLDNKAVITNHSDETKFGVTLNNLPREASLNTIRPIIPRTLHDHLRAVIFAAVTVVPPHVHTVDTVALNFYQDVADEVTTFWEETTTAPTFRRGRGYHLPDLSCLHPVEEFVAAPGDCWLLNTSVAHSVTTQSVLAANIPDLTTFRKYTALARQPRQIVQVVFQPDIKYAQVLDLLSA